MKYIDRLIILKSKTLIFLSFISELFDLLLLFMVHLYND